MIHVKMPDDWKMEKGQFSLYLAGGSEGISDWRQELVDLLGGTDVVLLNPRWSGYPISDHITKDKQSDWSYKYQRLAHIILFWLPEKTIQPAALYELGVWSKTTKPLFVGIHPDYPYIQDIELLLNSIRPDLEIVHSLQELYVQIRKAF